MLPIYAAMFNHLELYHRQLIEILASVPAEALDWSPSAEVNSLTVLITHICGAQRYWVGSASLASMLPRNRPSEFETTGLNTNTLKADLEFTLNYCKQILSQLTLDDLDYACAVLREGQPVTVSWALVHAVQHTALHVGHAQLMAQFWQHSAKK